MHYQSLIIIWIAFYYNIKDPHVNSLKLKRYRNGKGAINGNSSVVYIILMPVFRFLMKPFLK